MRQVVIVRDRGDHLVAPTLVAECKRWQKFHRHKNGTKIRINIPSVLSENRKRQP
jgi:hypothetical protein